MTERPKERPASIPLSVSLRDSVTPAALARSQHVAERAHESSPWGDLPFAGQLSFVLGRPPAIHANTPLPSIRVIGFPRANASAPEVKEEVVTKKPWLAMECLSEP